jgi:hypothetical protein
MPPLFKRPTIRKPKINIKKDFGISLKHKTMSLPPMKNVENWWDYLLKCTHDTKTDRNMIYWKYKSILDIMLSETEIKFLISHPFCKLSPKTKEILRKIYKNEFKK